MAAKLEVVDGSKPTSIRFTDGEKRELRRAAFLSEQSMGAFVRAAALKAAQRVARQALKAAA